MGYKRSTGLSDWIVQIPPSPPKIKPPFGRLPYNGITEGGICFRFCCAKTKDRPVYALDADSPPGCRIGSFKSLSFSAKKAALKAAFLAEKEGFEPSIPFWGIHDFQSCALGQLRDFSLSSPNIIPYSGRFVKSQFFIPLKSAPFSHLSNLIDKETEKWYSNGTIKNLSAPWPGLGPGENRESGANPERYRRCMRGGWQQDESRSLAQAEKALSSLGGASQKTCLGDGPLG